MLPASLLRVLIGLFFVFSSVSINASAQVGRLLGTVAYLDAYKRVSPARSASLLIVGAYGRAQSRADNNGNFALALPAGSYKVYAQGISGYTQRVEVYGSVRPYTDSYIYPNPLLLVHVSIRTSVETELVDSLAQLNELVSFTSIPGDQISSSSLFGQTDPQDDRAYVTGTVFYKKRGKEEPVRLVWVQAKAGYRAGGAVQTKENGTFELRAPGGTWDIVVQCVRGFRQSEIPHITVQKRDRPPGIRIELVADQKRQCP